MDGGTSIQLTPLLDLHTTRYEHEVMSHFRESHRNAELKLTRNLFIFCLFLPSTAVKAKLLAEIEHEVG